MQSLSKYNKGIQYLLCAIDLFSKYSSVAPLKDKRGIVIVNASQKLISKGRKPKTIWVDQGGEFYNKLFKRFLKTNDTEIYSSFNKGKSVIAKRFIRMLKNKILKCITAISKNDYFDLLDDIANKYNNTVHRTIKMKPIEITPDSYSKCNGDSNEKNPKCKAGHRVKILKYKNIFGKRYTQNWSEKVSVVSKIKDKVPCTYVISDLNGKLITGSFYEKELQKTNQKKFRIEKVPKKKMIVCMSNEKGMIIHLIVGLMKKTLYNNESILS